MATVVAERLREAILRGEYTAGQPLREIELCSALGVSRVPVREALHRLAGEGLVDIRPNHGATVAVPSEAQLEEIAEMCRMLESHLMQLAVPSLRPEALRQAAECLDELDRIDDPLEWVHLNWRFHRLLYEAADRPLTIEILSGLRARADQAMLLLVSEKKRRAALNTEHRAILAAANAGRGTLSATLLSAHLRSGRDEVLRLIRG